MIVDAHVTIGENRDVSLTVESLLRSMDEQGVDLAVASPSERFLPVNNHQGNRFITDVAGRSAGKIVAYAVASPWLGSAALAELEEAYDRGAAALKVDPALQGFDLLDGQICPLLEFATGLEWPVYVRTGTPPYGLPLQVGRLATEHRDTKFIMGRSGATDFSADALPALLENPNVYADTAYLAWPAAYAGDHPEADAAQRIVFSSDAPFGDLELERARVSERIQSQLILDRVLGGTMHALLTSGRSRHRSTPSSRLAEQ